MCMGVTNYTLITDVSIFQPNLTKIYHNKLIIYLQIVFEKLTVFPSHNIMKIQSLFWKNLQCFIHYKKIIKIPKYQVYIRLILLNIYNIYKDFYKLIKLK